MPGTQDTKVFYNDSIIYILHSWYVLNYLEIGKIK